MVSFEKKRFPYFQSLLRSIDEFVPANNEENRAKCKGNPDMKWHAILGYTNPVKG